MGAIHHPYRQPFLIGIKNNKCSQLCKNCVTIPVPIRECQGILANGILLNITKGVKIKVTLTHNECYRVKAPGRR
jgi:hypothetical protein